MTPFWQRLSGGTPRTPSHMNAAGGNPLDENPTPEDSADDRPYILESAQIGVVDATVPNTAVTGFQRHSGGSTYFRTQVGISLENGHPECWKLGIRLPNGLRLANVGIAAEVFTSAFGHGNTPSPRPNRGYYSGAPGPSFPIGGAAPNMVGTAHSYENWCLISTNPNGTIPDGTPNVNSITLVGAGRPVELYGILILSERDDGTVNKNRHYRIFLRNGDGTDGETFGYYKSFGGGHFGGAATTYAYDHPCGVMLKYGVRSQNGLQVLAQAFADGGHFSFIVMYRALGSRLVNEYGAAVWK